MDFLRRYAAVIFDVDGTIADSMHVWDALNDQWIRRHGLWGYDEYNRTVADLPLRDAAEYTIARYALPMTPQQLLDEWEAMAVALYAERVVPKPGARALMQALRERGVPMGVATAGHRGSCEGFLRGHGLWEYLTTVQYATQMRNKRYPDVYLACAREMGVDPGACVVFEDNPHTVAGVRAAGMGLVAVYDPSCADWEALRGAADWAVHSLEEFLQGVVPGRGL